MNFTVSFSSPAACVALIDTASYQAQEHHGIESRIQSAAGASNDVIGVVQEGIEAEGGLRVLALEKDEAWSNTMERHFCELASLFALNELSPEKEREFIQLQGLRRKLKTAPSLDESLHTYQRHKLEDEVMRAMERYVRFLKAKSNA